MHPLETRGKNRRPIPVAGLLEMGSGFVEAMGRLFFYGMTLEGVLETRTVGPVAVPMLRSDLGTTTEGMGDDVASVPRLARSDWEAASSADRGDGAILHASSEAGACLPEIGLVATWWGAPTVAAASHYPIVGAGPSHATMIRPTP